MLQLAVQKHSRLQYELSDLGVLKLVVYRKPVVMSQEEGTCLNRLVCEGDNLYKKSLTER